MIVARLRVMIGFLLAVGAMALALALAPNPAEAATVGNCSVYGTQPLGVTVSSTGVKTSGGVAKVYCSTNRYVQTQVQLWGDDVSSDDLRGQSYVAGYVYGTKYHYSARFNCNEDAGTDELYSKARSRIYTNGIWSAWSSWHQGPTYNYSC